MLPASSIVFPFTISVARLELAIALPHPNVLNFSSASFTYENFFGNTKDLKYYPKALADVQLQDLTTI